MVEVVDVLTVGESSTFLDRGGVIRFVSRPRSALNSRRTVAVASAKEITILENVHDLRFHGVSVAGRPVEPPGKTTP